LLSDVVTVSGGTATFADKHVGINKTVSATGFALGGTDVGNYVLSAAPVTATANITALSVSPSITASNKIYDATTAATILTRSLTGSIGGDDVSLSGGTATFADKNVGIGKAVTATGLSLAGASAGDYVLSSTSAATTADITARAITITAAAKTKTYGDVDPPLTYTITVGALAGSDVLSGALTRVAGETVAGSPYAIQQGTLDAGTNYATTYVGANLTITAKALTVSSITASSKVYDATDAATITNSTLSGIIGSDVVALTVGTAKFSDKNVGVAKTVTASALSLAGAAAANYSLASSTATTAADITALAVTGSFTAQNKTYDGNAAATVLTRLVNGAIAGDVVSLSGGTATFATKTVGNAKVVTLTGASLAGGDAANYNLTSVATTTANITALGVTASVTADNKVYDGNTSATIATRSLTGAIVGDVVSATGGTATFDNKNAGTGKTVTATGLSLSGADAANYVLTSSSATTTADVTAKTVTGSFTASNKVYDGTAAATISYRSIASGAVSGDNVTLTSGSATFADKSVGTAKTVTGTGFTLGGTDAGNYVLASTTLTTSADITALGITGAFTAANKIYDATTAATVLTRTLVGVLGTDAVSLTGGTATFASKTVANAKTVTLSGAALTGTDASNYTLISVSTTTADITAVALTPTVTVSNKVYDGNTSATIATRSLSGIIGSDGVTLVGGAASFANANVGAEKSVSVTGLSLSGADAGNYTVSSTASATADITPASLTPTVTVSDKVYDATTSATIATRTVAVVIGTDDVTLTGGTATFATKTVGVAKPVTISGLALTGAAAANYVLTSTTANATASITALGITGTFTAANKVYDGNTAATVNTRALSGVLGSDYVSLTGGSASFADKNVGTGKTVTLTGASLSGGDAANYSLTSVATATANITAKALTIAATGIDRVYDGTSAATVTLADNRVSGDVFVDAYTTAAFDTKHVGTAKTVSVSGISISGTDAGNYTFNATASTTANITALAITGSITANNKLYDATTAATIATRTLTGQISGDAVSYVGGSATFADKNVGTAKTVTATGLSLSGADAGNYTVNSTATTTANISARALLVSATGVNKIYDGGTAATVNLTDDRVAGDVLTDAYTSAAFGDKNVGTGKPVSVAGISISGADAGNYAANTTASAAADITPKQINGSFTAGDKTYDGTTTATITGRSVAGTISGDVVSLYGGTATFADKDVGAGKTVTGTGFTLAGADKNNYSLASTTLTTTAAISARALVVSAAGVNKVYDATTSATVTLSDNRVSGDVFTDSYSSAAFADKNVGIGKSVSVSGISISGTDAGNYTFNTTAGTTANITARPLAVTAIGTNKVYDGNTTASVTLADDRVSGDVFTDSYSTATFANKNVGTGKTISVSGISISGVDAGNYAANATTTTTANITSRSLAVSATGVNKVYDGTATATVTLSDDRVSGDVFVPSYTAASFGDKNVGVAKPVSVGGIAIAGLDAANYTANTTTSTTATIMARPLVVTATGQNKVYDGNATATVTLADNRVVGDALTSGYTSAAFSDKSVGLGKAVSVSGISISGADAGNYTFNATAATTANITALAITGSITANNKVYDATITATIATRTLTGQISGDAVSYSGGSASFVNKNVGTGKAVSASGLTLAGADAGNYTVNSTASTTADITVRGLVVTATGVNKVYDGTTVATVNLGDNRVAGDVFTDSYASATFATKNVGNGIAVAVSGISISGADAGNYAANTTATTSADITKKPISVKVHDQSLVWTGSTLTPVYTLDPIGSFAGGEGLADLGSPSFTPTTVVNVGLYTVTASGLNPQNYNVTPLSGTLTVVDNTKPTGNITQLNPVALNTAPTLKVNFTDVVTGNSNIVAWKYSLDGVDQTEIAVGSPTSNVNVQANLPPNAVTDVVTVCAQGKDAGGNWSVPACSLLAIYDPSAGFVTGGGWIDSPAGAYAANPLLTGKANFGFVSQYQKGATVPSGNTEFQFQAGNLNFKSTAFSWLVISGTTQSQFKGTGTINGAGNYNFLVTAIDGDNFNGTKKPDSFRIKITDAGGVVIYDNMMGADENSAAALIISGGSIQIQAK
jgi:hypothetical protein